MVAVAERNKDCIRALIELGADPLMKGCWFTTDDELDAFELSVALGGLQASAELLTLVANRDKKEATEPDVFKLNSLTNTLEPVRFHPEMRIKRVACGLSCSGMLDVRARVREREHVLCAD